MSEEQRTFWVVVSQVLPVLGLALVLEFRALVPSLQKRQPSGKFLYAFLVGIPTLAALGIAFGLIFSLSALATDTSPNWLLRGTIWTAIILSIAGVITTPAVSAIATTGGPFIIRRHLTRRLPTKSWRSGIRKYRAAQSEIIMLRSTIFQVMRENLHLKERAIALLEPPLREILDLAEIAQPEDDLRTLEARHEKHWLIFRATVDLEMRNRAEQARLKRAGHAPSAEYLAAVDKQIQYLSKRWDVVTGLPRFDYTAEYRDSQPDDGGFFPIDLDRR